MNDRQTVQYALQFLEELDHSTKNAMSPLDLSRRQGLPWAVCMSLMYRLSQAGIIELCEDGRIRLCRSLEDLTALEILQAVWAAGEKHTSFRMLVGGNQGMPLRKTLEFVRRVQGMGGEEIING